MARHVMRGGEHRSPRGVIVVLSTLVLAAVLSACSSSVTSTSSTTSSTAAPGAKRSYYVSLGDSFGAGVQPNASGQSLPTNQGYADDIYNDLRPAMPGLQLLNLACSGETTTSAMHGGTCHYDQGSQLAAAMSFIRANQRSIAFVTVELGANNFEHCVSNGEVNAGCVLDEVDTVKTELPQIFQQLRLAGGQQMKIVGMSLFDPFLAEWLTGALGQDLAQESVEFVREFNRTLVSIHRGQGARTANVANAFSTYEPFTSVTDLLGRGSVPVSVARICQWTWACAPAPQGPNEHPNATGYQQIANTFLPLVR